MCPNGAEDKQFAINACLFAGMPGLGDLPTRLIETPITEFPWDKPIDDGHIVLGELPDPLKRAYLLRRALKIEAEKIEEEMEGAMEKDDQAAFLQHASRILELAGQQHVLESLIELGIANFVVKHGGIDKIVGNGNHLAPCIHNNWNLVLHEDKRPSGIEILAIHLGG